MTTLYCQMEQGQPPSAMVCSTQQPGPHPPGPPFPWTGVASIVSISVMFVIVVVWIGCRYNIVTKRDYVSRKERRAGIKRDDRESAWKHEEEMEKLAIKRMDATTNSIYGTVPTVMAAPAKVARAAKGTSSREER